MQYEEYKHTLRHTALGTNDVLLGMVVYTGYRSVGPGELNSGTSKCKY
jgi:hypothetical protein